MNGLTTQHKAIGEKRNKSKKTDVQQQPEKAGAKRKRKSGEKTGKKQKKSRANKKKKSRANKKKKGGHHGPLLPTPTPPAPVIKPAPAYIVGQSVNCRYTDKKYYGAFVTGVNLDDNTYDVYFPDDSSQLCNVTAINIKLPITSGRTAKSTASYKGKMFFDEGSTGKEEGEEYFAPGTYVVKQIAADNNFFCLNIDNEDIKENQELFDMGYAIKRIRLFEEE